VHELDRDARDDRRRRTGRCRQIDEQRAQPLAACRERFGADFGDDAAIRNDGALESLLEIGEVRVEPGRLADLCQRAQRTASAVCNATIPPAKSRNCTSRKPAALISSASSSGPGKRRTLAGRYV
jgi:hypothetical protein